MPQENARESSLPGLRAGRGGSGEFGCGGAALLMEVDTAMARILGTGAVVLFLAGCVVSGGAKFPPEGVDHLRMTVDLEVEIIGIGKDAISLEGTSIVHRGEGSGPEGSQMKGDLVAAKLRGDSKVFGRVVAISSPIQHSPCQYEWKGPNSYQGYFDILSWFFLPQHDLIVFNKKPVRVAGPAERIPPVGQVAEALEGPIELYDYRKPGAQPIGNLTKAKGTILSEVDFEENMKIQDEAVGDLKPR